MLEQENNYLCQRDYAERIVSSCAHQTQSEYYGGNRFVSIEGIALEHFSSSYQSISSLTSETVSQQAVFCSFLSDDIKQYAATTVSYSKHIMELLRYIT